MQPFYNKLTTGNLQEKKQGKEALYQIMKASIEHNTERYLVRIAGCLFTVSRKIGGFFRFSPSPNPNYELQAFDLACHPALARRRTAI
jgi:hypothetical protein